MNLLLAKLGGLAALVAMSYTAGYGYRSVKAGLEDAVRVGEQNAADEQHAEALRKREEQKRESDEATKQVLAWGVAERDRLAARVKRLQQQSGAGSGVPIVPGTDGSLEACQQRSNDIARRAERTDEALARVNREVAACVGEVIRLGECQAYLTACQRRR